MPLARWRHGADGMIAASNLSRDFGTLSVGSRGIRARRETCEGSTDPAGSSGVCVPRVALRLRRTADIDERHATKCVKADVELADG
jgi:hypothetical protein